MCLLGTTLGLTGLSVCCGQLMSERPLWLGCALVLGSYTGCACCTGLTYRADERQPLLRVLCTGMYNAACVCLCGGAGVAAVNDREWDWGYAFSVMLALFVSGYAAGGVAWSCSSLGGGDESWEQAVAALLLAPVFILEEAWAVLTRLSSD